MSWNEEQGHGEKVQRGWERERDELRREIEATRRTAGYLAVMVRARDPRTSDYAAEILDTPEIAEALKAAGGA